MLCVNITQDFFQNIFDRRPRQRNALEYLQFCGMYANLPRPKAQHFGKNITFTQSGKKTQLLEKNCTLD